MAPSWLVYSPCKNNSSDAAKAVIQGVPANSPFTAECDQYGVFVRLLQLIGVSVSPDVNVTIHGITACPGPQIVIKPSVALFPSEIHEIFVYPSKVYISPTSSLVISGTDLKSMADETVSTVDVPIATEPFENKANDSTPSRDVSPIGLVTIESLQLNGSLKLIATPRTQLIVRAGVKQGGVHNAGQVITPTVVTPDTSEVESMRGYVYKVNGEELVVTPASINEDTLVYVFNGRSLIPGNAMDVEDEDSSNNRDVLSQNSTSYSNWCLPAKSCIP